MPFSLLSWFKQGFYQAFQPPCTLCGRTDRAPARSRSLPIVTRQPPLQPPSQNPTPLNHPNHFAELSPDYAGFDEFYFDGLCFDSFCFDCQKQLAQALLADPGQFWQAQPHVFAWGTYTGVLKRTIGQLKYQAKPELAVALGQGLAQTWLNHPISRQVQKPVIVPIPLHIQKQQQRGYNQAELIARHFCQVTGYRLFAQGLQRSRQTEALFKLSPQQRQETLAQVFDLGADFRRHLPTQPVLLIDDIYTTGATVREAIRAFHRHGVRVYGVAVVAKAGGAATIPEPPVLPSSRLFTP